MMYCNQESVEASNIDKLDDLNVGAAVILDAAIELDSEEVIEMMEKAKTDLEVQVEVKKKESNIFMVNVNDTLNVRTERDEESERAGLLYKDCGGTILEQADGWSKIQSGDLVGWAKDDYLLFGEEAETLAQEVGRSIATVNADALKIRQSASEEAKVYGLVAPGEKLDLVREEGDWGVVNFEGSDGFLSKKYLDIEFVIDQGETMEVIEDRESKIAEEKAKMKVNYAAMPAGATDIELLAALIHCEAGGESYEGQLAVGAVVMNRVRSPGYPNTIEGVIFASGQFTPALSGKVGERVAIGSYASATQAAMDAISGVSNVGAVTRFRRNDGRPGHVIGNHVFW